jgi:hypothetical protein
MELKVTISNFRVSLLVTSPHSRPFKSPATRRLTIYKTPMAFEESRNSCHILQQERGREDFTIPCLEREQQNILVIHSSRLEPKDRGTVLLERHTQNCA